MFLFNKRTKKIIKYIWAIFALLIILSMIFAYSGFTSLSRTDSREPIEVPPEVREQLRAQQLGEDIDIDSIGKTPEEIEALKAIKEGRVNYGTTSATDTTSSTTEYEMSQKNDLKLEI